MSKNLLKDSVKNLSKKFVKNSVQKSVKKSFKKIKVNIGKVCANSANRETMFSGADRASVISINITKY